MKIKKRDHRQRVSPAVVDLIEKANQGDVGALQELQRVFDRDATITAFVGDLIGHVKQLLAEQTAGRDALGLNDAIQLQSELLEEALEAEAGSELERLLARRVALCSLAVGVAELKLAEAQRATGPGAATTVRELIHRVDRAHTRLLSATKCLAVVRQLCRPKLTPMQMLAGSSQTRKAEPAGFRRPVGEESDLVGFGIN